jgi:hypothetical protein
MRQTGWIARWPPATARGHGLRGLESALGGARASSYAAVAETAGLRARIYERLRRVQWLDELLAQARQSSTPTDRVRAPRLVTMLPSGQTGRSTRLDGTLVAGSYRLEQGPSDRCAAPMGTCSA